MIGSQALRASKWAWGQVGAGKCPDLGPLTPTCPPTHCPIFDAINRVLRPAPLVAIFVVVLPNRQGCVIR